MKTLEAFVGDGLAAQRAVDQVLDSQSPIANSQERKRARTLNPTCFINAAACREFLLEHADGTRAHRFTRVSGETLQRLNEHLRAKMVELVRGLPSKGKTI